MALQTAMPSPSGAAMKACGSMAKWVTMGNVQVSSTTRSAARGLHVAPAHAVLAQDVRLRQRVAGRSVPGPARAAHRGRGRPPASRRRAAPRSGRARARAASSAASSDVGRHDRHRLAVVARLADGEDGPVVELRAEARHRLGQVGGRQHEADAGHGECGRGRRWPRCGRARRAGVTSLACSSSGRWMSAT